MRKVLLFLAIGILFTMTSNAQMLCAFDAKMEELKRQKPEYVQQLEQTEQYIRNFIVANPQNARKPMVVYTIPVVVHVMHTGGALGSIYNPTDLQIMGAIDYLNKIYDGTLSGMEEPVEGGGVVKMELKFVLAKRTSGCGYTNGIVRVDASGIPKYEENGVSGIGCPELELKNYSRWNPADYYNIWLVNKINGDNGGIAGYAYFADVPAVLDGIVMLARDMIAGSKTLPHELGHAFGLYHTFDESNSNTSCPKNDDCATEGDRVCDTDPVSNNINSLGNYDFTPRTGLNICASKDFNRNTESNFMAYTSRYTLFTNGQKARVQATMSLPRRISLSNSPGATPCGPVINFGVATDIKTEDNTGSTSGCRTYKDYTYQLVIGEAPGASATVTLSYSGTATKGLDYDVTTNGSFTSPSNEVIFAAGSIAPQVFTIRVYDDLNEESAETAIVNLSVNTSGSAAAGTSIPTFVFTIKDNDLPLVVASSNTYTIGELTSKVMNDPFNSTNVKHRGQFSYKASELMAAGFRPGAINSMQLRVALKTATGSFNGFTIKIGSSTADYLQDGAKNLGTDFTTVYTNASFSTILGWNTFPFSTPYVWDGKSNIVVEYCYNSVTGTGYDRLSVYSDGGTQYQYNYIFQKGVDCSAEYSKITGYSNGIKPVIRFGIDITGVEVETTTSGTSLQNVSIGSNDHFYSNSNKIIAKIGNVNADLGCVQVSVENAGTSWLPLPFGKRSAKVIAVKPAANGSTASHTISLYFTKDELDGRDPATLKMAKTTAATIAGINAGNTEILTPVLTMLGDNAVFTASFTGFSRFFLTENLGALPISLLSFTGELNNQSEADLSWKVTNQRNFKGFDVERSPDGRLFNAIEHVAATDENAALHEYNFTDKMVSQGLNYYRLKMIDNDGNFSYSEVIKIVNNSSGQFVTLMSNPVKEVITLSINNNNLRPIAAQLYNAVGAKVATWQLGTRTGSAQLPVEQYKLTPGVYLLQVSDGNQVETFKVVKN